MRLSIFQGDPSDRNVLLMTEMKRALKNLEKGEKIDLEKVLLNKFKFLPKSPCFIGNTGRGI